MGLYQNNNGTLVPIAGRGKAEYGASTVRKGTATIPQFETGDSIAKNVQVTFDSPMPDTDYIVNLEELSSTNIYTSRVCEKTVNGFTIVARLAFATTTTVEQGPINARSIYWKAFKLYTDTEYNNILDAMPDDASISNKLATADIIQDVYEVMGKNGAKNLLAYPYQATSSVINGITWTDNGDGTVTANGTATGNSIFRCHTRGLGDLNDWTIDNGAYILSGCPSGGSGTTYFMQSGCTKNGEWVENERDYGNGATFIVNGDDFYADKANMTVTCVMINGATASNLTFKPMIRLASDTDSTWQPYVPTNRELVSWKANSKMGAKNLIPYPYINSTRTVNGVTFTDNGNGTITVNGTATDDVGFNMYARATTNNLLSAIGAGKYILTGCPQGGSMSTYCIDFGYGNAESYVGNIARDTGDGANAIITSDMLSYNGQITIVVKQGITLTNAVFRPMLRLASDTDDTYQPYAMTNKQLTNRVIQSVESITLDNTTTDAGNIKLYRYGNLRILTGHFRPTVAGTSGENAHIADLPSSADYPQFDVPALCGRGAGSSTAESKIGNILVRTNGSLTFQGKDLGENMFFNITWVVA